MFNSLTLENMAAFQKLQWQPDEHLNLIIGENDSGKTHLLKLLYGIARSLEDYQKRKNSDQSLRWAEVLAEKLRWTFQPPALKLGQLVHKGKSQLSVNAQLADNSINLSFSFGDKTTRQIRQFTPKVLETNTLIRALFLPPKEILTVMDAIEATRSQLEIIGFDDTYIDLIRTLRLPESQGKLHPDLKKAVALLDEQMGNGQIDIEKNEWVFKRADMNKYAMSQTAEGFKKIGILNRLLKNRMLKPGSILLVDEPEVNLHPKAVVALVDIFFQIAQSGIQIYIATHSYFVLRRFEWLARKYNKSIGLCSLFRHPKNGVVAQFDNLREGMPANSIIDVSIELYEQNVRLDFET